MSEDYKERIPFNVGELVQMFDKEFYLMLISDDAMEQTAKALQRTNVSEEKLADLKLVEGGLAEIISREPHYCLLYELGELKSVTYEDGTPVGKNIKKIPYIFMMESVEFSSGQPPVLRGTARAYDSHCDSVGEPLKQKVVLYMAKKPTHKEILRMVCP